MLEWWAMKTIKIRDVPDEVHRRLTNRAAAQEKSVSELVVAALGDLLERPNNREVLQRIASREPFEVDAAAEVRAIRGDL